MHDGRLVPEAMGVGVEQEGVLRELLPDEKRLSRTYRCRLTAVQNAAEFFNTIAANRIKASHDVPAQNRRALLAVVDRFRHQMRGAGRVSRAHGHQRG